MINIEQLKQEVSEVTHEFDRKVAMQVIDYLSEKGYLRDEWRPIETAPKNCENILVYRPVHDCSYIPVVGEDYWVLLCSIQKGVGWSPAQIANQLTGCRCQNHRRENRMMQKLKWDFKVTKDELFDLFKKREKARDYYDIISMYQAPHDASEGEKFENSLRYAHAKREFETISSKYQLAIDNYLNGE